MKSIITKYVWSACLFLIWVAGYAQIPKIDVSFREELVLRKAAHHRQMMDCLQQITPNQEKYDIRYYAIDLTPDPVDALLTGVAEITAEVLVSSLDRVELNFWSGMTITGIHLYDHPETVLEFEGQEDMLTILLDKAYDPGEQFHIVIEYHGQPQESGYDSFTFDTYEGEPMIWTISSVFGARAWWPCKDIPSDKPDSMDIRVTVPSDLIVASNGSLRQTQSSGELTTYWWHEKYPIATYLVFLSIYPYEMHSDEYVYNNGADTMPILFYNFPGVHEENYRINSLVKDILAYYAGLFGEYPFVDEKYGQVDFLWAGGMEHQTCTSYGGWSEFLYAHEISHQWWGDMITCDSFHHIWLNEGFASYCEALWFEHAYAPLTASDYQMVYQQYLGPGTVYVEDPQNEDIFDHDLSYNKASWILHMLRHVVGDEVFFDILKAYYASPQNQYGTATTEEFQAVCEQVSGMDLDRFFHQWLHEEYYPRYSYSWNREENGSGYDINVEIRQEQDNCIFWMPIDITVSTVTGDTTFVVWDSLATQSFAFSVSSWPLDLDLDKDNWILKILLEEIENPSFDRGILLVNGIQLDMYPESVRNRYATRSYWGDFPISFWDCFYAPEDGYPTALPEPLGHGRVPADVLKQFSTVIWIGNHYNGDLYSWLQTPVLAYLEAGGNLLLMTRNGNEFIVGPLQDYLGITWTDDRYGVINSCTAVYPGLADLQVIGSHWISSLFYLSSVGHDGTLLFTETTSYDSDRGIGVWCHPEGGGSYRSSGGQFVFISGRPYHYDAESLQANVEFILTNMMQERIQQPVEEPDRFTLEQNYPNPFNGTTGIRYFLTEAGNVTCKIYNLRGELIQIILEDEMQSEGYQESYWDGTDMYGIRVGSGIYFYQLHCRGHRAVQKMLLLR